MSNGKREIERERGGGGERRGEGRGKREDGGEKGGEGRRINLAVKKKKKKKRKPSWRELR